MPAPTLQDFQYWFGTNESGSLFGIDTNIDVVDVEGLEAISVRSGTRELPRSDGAVPGLHLMGRKYPIFNLEVQGNSQYHQFHRDFNILPNEEGELHWKYPGKGQVFSRARIYVRPDRRDGLSFDSFSTSVVFEVANPRIYSVTQRSRTLGVFSTGGEGVDWGLDFGVDFSAVAGGGVDTVANNAGNTAAYPLVRFYGPIVGTCEGVRLENLTTGEDLEIETAILTDQILTADMSARATGAGRRIIDLDGSSRYGDWVLPRDTFNLHPGDNVLRLVLTGASTSTDVIAVVQWRDTYY